MKASRSRERMVLMMGIIFQLLILAIECSVTRQRILRNNTDDNVWYPPVQLLRRDDNPLVQLLRRDDNHVVVDNGIFKVTFSTPDGMVTGIEYNGIDNILEEDNEETNRGYWDVVWTKPDESKNIIDKFEGERFSVIMENEDQVELSFARDWSSSLNNTNAVALKFDKRFVILRGYSGFYSYGIMERLNGWPDIDIYQGRIVFKLQANSFRYMAVSDERQRIMPTLKDRERGEELEYPEAVLLTNPSNPFLRGEVDDKYQYSAENKDNRVHGWICSEPPVGFWMITPSSEFRNAGPLKQDLTSHAGPITLSMFFSTHYAGESSGLKFRNGEAWKKVFGPVFIYLNYVLDDDDPLKLWDDAKQQMLLETESWPYYFPRSKDFVRGRHRGMVSGRLLIRDEITLGKTLATANSAYVGLASPGEVGSWQRESKGYQFWTTTDSEGYFSIKHIHPGNYSLYAWVPGFIGDYKNDFFIIVEPGDKIRLGVLVYEPPRNGKTIWEIGIPDRTAAEFYVPEPNPSLMNQLYVSERAETFRQYGLWDRYSQIFPDEDLVYTIGVSDYQTDWFFAHVNRHVGNQTYIPTTWRVLFDLDYVDPRAYYTLQLALASSNGAELQVRINDESDADPYFTTGLIGKDNAIARHGIHGLYSLYSVDVSGAQFRPGQNVLYLTQSRGVSPFAGIMYDYIRLEQPGS